MSTSTLWNWNTRLAIILCVVSGIADSIWIDTVLSSFLYGLARLMGKEDQENTLVGWGEASWGVSQLLFALPIGFLADKWSKAKTIRLGSVVMFLAIVVTFWAVQRGADSEDKQDSASDAKMSYFVMIFAMVVWGIVGGITNGPAQALFADALPEKLRTEGYTYLFAAYLVSSSCGSIVTIFLFKRLSDHYDDWKLKEIRPVFFVGLFLEIFVGIIMMFFRDVKVVQNEDGTETTTTTEPNINTEEETIITERKMPINRRIPLLLFTSSLVTALGSGASVKFFPLFFKDLGLSPQNVQLIFVFDPLAIALFTFLAKRLANKIGRIKATVFLETFGASLLLLMSYLHHSGIKDSWIMISIYLLRTALMNCSYALIESVLMSSVPSDERARWKSLESIAAVSWTGSAVLGGVISDARGYAFAFGITAILQMIGSWIIFPLHSIVPKEEEDGESIDKLQNGNDTNNNNTLSEPLINGSQQEV